MKSFTCLFTFFLAYSMVVNAQNGVGIGTTTPNANALLDVSSTTKGVLIPRLNSTQMNAITSPAGIIIYNTDSNAFAYRNATAWVFLKGNAIGSNNWNTRGNAGINPVNHFIGTTDNVPLNFRVNNIAAGRIDPIKLSTFLGQGSGNPAQTGERNVGIGYLSLAENTSGEKNTAMGVQALNFNLNGGNNTAVGYDAMYYNESGSLNTALGVNALNTNVSGSSNTGIGLSTLFSNETGENNTALGRNAGYNALGSGNVFVGYQAGYAETGSNKLYINNGDADANNALIYGEFDNKILSISGRLGIGTTMPSALLHVNNANTDADASQLIIEGNSNFGNSTTSAIEFRSNFSNGEPGPSGRIKSYYTSNNYTDAKTTFQTVAPGPAFVDAMTLTNGRVGIGTTTPHAALHLPQTLANRKIILLEDADNDHQFNGFGINTFILRYQAAATTSSHVFFAGTSASSSTELMRITGNGEVGIGKLPLTSSNDSRLQVKQKGIQNGIGIEAANSSNHWDFYVTADAASNLVLYYNSINKGTFDNVTGAYAANSDRLLKKDITPQAPVLNNVMQLQAYQYHYLDNQPTDRFSNGFMAQDVQKVFPDAVVENTMKDGQTRLGINYQYFTVLAIKGLQEQQKEMEAMRTQIKLMMEEIAQLKAK